ncbi:glycosyltransferase [bacterium]|nr:glycosyltransferase [bacterium]
MNEKIAVSVIVPVYNVEKYLKRCLNSLINQTLKNIEIICINDGSTDKSAKILNEYSSDKRIKIINQQNSGPSISRNKGINIAKGEYIGFIDSDDWVDLDFYEKLYKSATKHNTDIATAGIIRLHKLHKKYHLKITKEEISNNTNEKFLLCDCPEKSYVWNKIYKTEWLKSNNLKFEEGIIYEDVIFTPEVLFYSDKIVTVPNTYYYYWRRKNSLITQRHKKAQIDSVYAHNKAKEFINNHNIDISQQEVKTTRTKIFGITLFKIKTRNKKKEYIIFNVLKFGKF